MGRTVPVQPPLPVSSDGFDLLYHLADRTETSQGLPDPLLSSSLSDSFPWSRPAPSGSGSGPQ